MNSSAVSNSIERSIVTDWRTSEEQRSGRDEPALSNELPRGVPQELAHHEIVLGEARDDARNLQRLHAALHPFRGRRLRAEHFGVPLRIGRKRPERGADDTAVARLELAE